jgi:transposase-like protein
VRHLEERNDSIQQFVILGLICRTVDSRNDSTDEPICVSRRAWLKFGANAIYIGSGSRRARNNSIPAGPYIWRLSVLRRLMSSAPAPSTDAAWRAFPHAEETVREWCDKFGPYFAEELRRRNKGKLGNKWYLDEVFLKIKGVQHYLWRAVDQNRAVIDILVQPKRDRIAAERFFRKLLIRAGREPRVIVTDKLRSYGAAKRTVLQNVIHRQSGYLNNRAENSPISIAKRLPVGRIKWGVIFARKYSLGD